MFESGGLERLLDALAAGAPADRLSSLLEEPELGRIFPSLGVPPGTGLRALVALAAPADAKEGDETQRAIEGYFAELLAARGQVQDQIESLRGTESDLTARAFARTRGMLPEGTELGEVRLVVLPLGFDFRTDGATVYLDPLAALQYGTEGLVQTLAHELHHVGRFRRTGENPTLMRPPEPTPPETLREAFQEAAAWLELEGIADAVSNLTQSRAPALRNAAARRRSEMDQYGELLRQALEPFRGQDPERRPPPAVGERLRAVAHPVGARMAEKVREAHGEDALVDCVGDPGRFFRLYESAARTLGGEPVDPELLALLGERRFSQAHLEPTTD